MRALYDTMGMANRLRRSHFVKYSTESVSAY